jgi:putative transposase
VGEPLVSSLSVALQVLKQKTSRKLKKKGDKQFWQRRYDDFNVHSELKTVEKLRTMHRNPVKRGLVTKPEDWEWSSFVHYATGKVGTVEIESEWTAWRREQNKMLVNARLCRPPFAKNAKDGAPAALGRENV